MPRKTPLSRPKPSNPKSSEPRKARNVRGKGQPSVEGAVGRQKLIYATRELLRTIQTLAQKTSQEVIQIKQTDR